MANREAVQYGPQTASVFGAPDQIANAAEAFYEANHKEILEKDHSGEFVAIDVQNEKVYVDEFAYLALQKARKRCPHGIFHLIRIGSPSTFKGGRLGHHEYGWRVLRQAG